MSPPARATAADSRATPSCLASEHPRSPDSQEDLNKLPTLSLPTAAPVNRAPRTECPVLAHAVGALRSHRRYLPADMGTKVMSAAARWLLLRPSGRARLPQTDHRCWSANRLMLTTPGCPDLRALRNRRGRYEHSEERGPGSWWLGGPIRFARGVPQPDQRRLPWLTLASFW